MTTDKPKKPRGRPEIPPEDRAVNRSVRLTVKQWAKLDLLGGIPWIRDRIDKAKEPKP